jgi:hypothetical protein
VPTQRADAAAETAGGSESAPISRKPRFRLPDAVVPLRIARRKFWLCGIGLAIFSIVVIVGSPLCGFVDFPQFWAAGHTVGTPSLLDPARHMDWQSANGIKPGFFVYPAGSAWLFAPFAAVPLAVGFWLHAIVMTGLVAAAGILGARVYGLDRRVGLVAAFAWAPCMGSAITGQNAALGLVLSLVAIEGLRRDSDGLAGLGVGLLLYKPTLALPLIGLLLLKRRWRALLIAIVLAGGWYLAGVAAAAGDWSWPRHWLSVMADYYAADTAGNVVRTISIPGLLQGHGVPSYVAWAVALAVVALAIPRLLRRPIAEAGAGACLIALAISPHALNYEGALVLPILMWALGATRTGIAEPARTRLVVAAYLVAPEYLISETVGLSSLVVVTAVAAAIWISGWRRVETPPPAGAGAARREPA